MSSWACSSCTLMNPVSLDQCELCRKPQRPTLSSSIPALASSSSLGNTPQWSCRACTFLNNQSDKVCDICGTPRDIIANLGSALNNTVAAVNDKDRDEGVYHHIVNDVDIEDDDYDEKEKKRMEMLWGMEEAMMRETRGSRKVEESRLAHHAIISDGAPGKRKSPDDLKSNTIIVSDCGSSANTMLRQLHLERVGRRRQAQAIAQDDPSIADHCMNSVGSQSCSVQHDDGSISVLTYNVWFREDLQVTQRMNAIGEIICEHNPHFICLQEVTPAIYNLFQSSTWWSRYQCSLTPASASKRAYFCILLSRIPNTSFNRSSYHNTVMGRELCISKVEILGGKQLFVATTHLESPCPAPPTWNQMFSLERIGQAKEALNALKGHSNVVFGGDMNWDDKLDGSPPLPRGWCDAWLVLHPEEEGFTYDCKENPMLSGSRLRKRLDRLFCHLDDFKLESIERVGRNPIPGVTFQKEMKVKRQPQVVDLPVLPSDHFGLLLKLLPRL